MKELSDFYIEIVLHILKVCTLMTKKHKILNNLYAFKIKKILHNCNKKVHINRKVRQYIIDKRADNIFFKHKALTGR